MRKPLLKLWIVLFLMPGYGYLMHGQKLDKLQWKNRILLVKASNGNSQLLTHQWEEFEDYGSEMQERKLVFYEFVGNQYRICDFKDKGDEAKWMQAEFIPKLLQKNNKPFEVVLIGLDGGVKLRQQTILKREELFRIIDSMPMRRQEIRRKSDF
ncbi:MAG: DUF4174 domain-containing protein [Bacteroidota bacterium]